MRQYISYLKYIARHKWFVFQAGMEMGCPLWRLLIHDLSKLRPSEWIPYMDTFYKEDGSKRYSPTEAFDYAWNDHQKRNKHHYQYWVLLKDDGSEQILDMPHIYVMEMVADWAGAGRAINGVWEVVDWYEKNVSKIKISSMTKIRVKKLLDLYWRR